MFLTDTLEDNRMDTVCSEIATLHVSHIHDSSKMQMENAQRQVYLNKCVIDFSTNMPWQNANFFT